MENETNRFSFLEIDDIPAPVATPANPNPAPVIVQTSVEAFRPMPVATPVATPAPAMEISPSRMVAVKNEADSTGSILFWRLGGTIEVAKLAAAVKEAGLSDKFLPNDVTPGAAFTRATEALKERDTLVRKHPKGGILIVEEIQKGDDLDYRKCCRLFLEEGELKSETLDYSDTETAAIRDQVNRDYQTALATYAHIELSAYLVAAAKTLKGVTFTRSGGFYYVGKEEAKVMAKVQSVVETLGVSKVYLIPVTESSQTVRAVFDAVALEMGQRFDEMADELNAGTGKRAAAHRLDELTEISTTIKHYETLLGVQFNAVEVRRLALVERYGKVAERGNLLEA